MGGIKNQVFDPSLKCTDSRKPKKRLYQVWEGHNKFLCGGRLVFGPDAGSLYLTTFLIGGPALTFCINMLMRLPTVDFLYGRIVLTVGVILLILDLIFLFLTSARNPGIVPRNSTPPDLECGSFASSSIDWFNSETLDVKLPRTKDVFVNGVTIKVKYCDTCLLYRPPRASHCSICNNCVERFDHHCPWLGQCIGVRNYRTFILFVTTSTLLCLHVFTFSLVTLVNEPGSIWKSMSRDGVFVFLIVYCFIAVWFVGGLSIFHFYLICTNQTTYENFRYRYDKRENPYNQTMIKNIKEVFFSRTVPSLVNFREWVIEEDDSIVGSISKRFGGDVKSLKGKTDFEVGILGKDGEVPLPDILQNLDYSGIDESLKKDNSEKIAYDPFFLSTQDEEYSPL